MKNFTYKAKKIQLDGKKPYILKKNIKIQG